MRGLITIAALTAATLTLTACSYDKTANDKEQDRQAASDTQQAVNQPVPAFAYSQLKQNLIEIETAEAKGVQTTSFIMGNLGSPDPIQVCPSVGVPLPVDTSLTNPQQLDGRWMNNDGSGGRYIDGVVGQKEPTGIFPGHGQGTFVICIGADGASVPVYAEGLVTTVFGPAVWDYGSHSVRITGPSSFRFSKSQGK